MILLFPSHPFSFKVQLWSRVKPKVKNSLGAHQLARTFKGKSQSKGYQSSRYAASGYLRMNGCPTEAVRSVRSAVVFLTCFPRD